MNGDKLSRDFLKSLAQLPETPEQKAAREHEVFVRIAVESIKSAIFEAAKNRLTSYTVHVTATPEPEQHSLDPSLYNDVFPILQQDVGNVSCVNLACTYESCINGTGCIHFDWS
jgi:hypothetical protein